MVNVIFVAALIGVLNIIGKYVEVSIWFCVWRIKEKQKIAKGKDGTARGI